MLLRTLLFFYLPNLLLSQSFEPKVNIPIVEVGIGTFATGSIIMANTCPLYERDLAQFDRNKLNLIERTATYNYSVSAKKTSDILLWSSVALPLTTLASTEGRNNFGAIAIMAAENIILSAGVNYLTKSLVKRTRPFVYNPDAPLSEKLKKDARLSFYSGHTSMTAASCFFTASIFNQTLKDKSAMPYIWASASIIPAITGYCRWKAGKHFPSDILVGYLVGMATGLLTSQLH